MRANAYIHRLIIARATDALDAFGHLDLREPDCARNDRDRGRYVRWKLDGNIPTLIYFSRCYRDEWIVSVALWPTDGAEDAMQYSSSGSRAGECFCFGWVNRWQFKGRALGIELFDDAKAYVAPSRRGRVDSIAVPVRGIAADLMRLYNRRQGRATKAASDGFVYA